MPPRWPQVRLRVSPFPKQPEIPARGHTSSGVSTARGGQRGDPALSSPQRSRLSSAAPLAWRPGLWLGSAADLIAAGGRALADTPTASASLPRGNRTLLLLQSVAQSWSGGAAWPQVPPCGGRAHCGFLSGESPVPLGDLRDQRQRCLEDRGLNQLLGCDADPLLLLGELGRVRPPSLPQFPHLQGLCSPLFL